MARKSQDVQPATEVKLAPAEVLYQGAEARISISDFAGRPCIVKERFAKLYRHPELDLKLRRSRLKAECKALIRCMELSIRVPCVYYVDQAACSIWMERLPGPTVRQFLFEHVSTEQIADGKSRDRRTKHVAQLIGYFVGRMHRNGIVHGDLTTSNIIVTNFENQAGANEKMNVEIAFIDFGLSSFDQTAESFGVDLYVLERAITSAHNDSDRIWQPILDGYKTGFVGDVDSSGHSSPCGAVAKSTTKHSPSTKTKARELEAVLSRYNDVRLRGRKRNMIG